MSLGRVGRAVLYNERAWKSFTTTSGCEGTETVICEEQKGCRTRSGSFAGCISFSIILVTHWKLASWVRCDLYHIIARREGKHVREQRDEELMCRGWTSLTKLFMDNAACHCPSAPATDIVSAVTSRLPFLSMPILYCCIIVLAEKQEAGQYSERRTVFFIYR